MQVDRLARNGRNGDLPCSIMPIYRLDERLLFPNPLLAEEEGLLAVGGDLRPERLLLAYEYGIFPWFNAGEPPMWWCPDPRYVLFPDKLNVSASMRSLLRKRPFSVTMDTAFRDVIHGCAAQSLGRTEGGTWITSGMESAYIQLHDLGFAHSVEVWLDEDLVGGLYGVSLGNIFFGESMFTRISNASKFGFVHLVHQLQEWGFDLIDCQQGTRHLIGLGAEPIPRKTFLAILEGQEPGSTRRGKWIMHG